MVKLFELLDLSSNVEFNEGLMIIEFKVYDEGRKDSAIVEINRDMTMEEAVDALQKGVDVVGFDES